MARRALTIAQMQQLAAPLAVAAGVSVPLVLAIARQESGFAPWALRGEPHLKDASIGLMQILVSTARAMGYTGLVGAYNDATNQGTGLFDPATNLKYGIRQLHNLLVATGNDLPRAVAAYNAGMGNSQRFTHDARFCLAWKPTAPATGRQLDRDCAEIRTVKAGEFGNQPYVDRVLSFARVYGLSASAVAVGGGVAIPGGGSETTAPGTPQPSTVPRTGTSYFVVSAGLMIAAGAMIGLMWMLQKAKG